MDAHAWHDMYIPYKSILFDNDCYKCHAPFKITMRGYSIYYLDSSFDDQPTRILSVKAVISNTIY